MVTSARAGETVLPVGREPWPPRSRLIVFLLALFIMLAFGDKAILGLVGTPMMEDLGLTNAQFGLIGSSFSLLFCFTAIAVGLLGNRISPRWLLAGLALVWSVAQLPVLLPVVGFAGLVGTRILLGAGEGPALPLASHTAFTWVPVRSRALAAALLAVGGGAGIIVGAPLLMLAIQAWGWRAPFGILGALGLVWAVAWLALGGAGPHFYAAPGTTAGNALPTGSRRTPGKAAGDAPDPASGALPPETAPPAGETPGRTQGEPAATLPERLPYRRVFAQGTWWGAVLAGFTVSWMLGLALTWLPTYLEEQAGYSPQTVSLLVGLPSIGSIVSILTAGLVTDRLLRRGASRHVAYGVVPAVALVAGGIALFAMSRVGAGWPLLAAMAIGFSAGPALTPLANAAMAEISPPAQRAAVLATAHAFVTTGSVASPFVSGLIVDLASSESVGFTAALDLAAVLLLVGAALAATAIRPDRHAARLASG
ncbi:MFS transporter [Cryptosporangium aurantiacum]|uniref:Sugar phosphate permease n=1 Tax=Cryptosporangium aurantiacum TaxID=134849 RepID=A0A1M7Q7T3_9ACTN|nr:MFS transporter [Cryptosporangium aurantiacum]SHN26476.1 Sugar phosphate permease [Cryptosporangium aurantiacum]